MSSGRKGNNDELGGNIFARAATAAVNQIINGQHADKRTARQLHCSLRLAKYLRAGKYWTLERLSIASAILGDEFDRLLMPHLHTIERAPPRGNDDVHEKLDRLLEEISTVKDQISAVNDELNNLKARLGASDVEKSGKALARAATASHSEMSQFGRSHDKSAGRAGGWVSGQDRAGKAMVVE